MTEFSFLGELSDSILLSFTFSGLYGHSAVYHEQTDAVYVFGGYRFHVEAVEPSGELYSLYYPNLTWSLLVPSQGNKVTVIKPPQKTNVVSEY